MAPVSRMNGTQLLVQIGDGADPEVFAHDCLINTSRGIAFSSDENREVIPNCSDPDAPGWSVLNKDGLSGAITGAGMLHTSSVKSWFNWFNSDDGKNIRVAVAVPGASGGGYWAGVFKLTSFEVTGERNATAQVSVSLGSDGPVVWVDAA